MPLGALLLRRDGHDLVYVGLARDEALGLRRTRRLFADRAFVRPAVGSPATLARIRKSAPELVVSWFWPKRLPTEVLELAPAIGVHPSLLPRHRGPDPYFWAIDCGDVETGVTAHVLDATYDTGPTLGTRTLHIDPSWNAWTLAKKLDRPSLSLLRETVAAYARRSPPQARPQDESRATVAPSPTEDMLEIRWDDTAESIARRVRAAAPWPGAFTEIGGVTVVLTEARPTSDFPRALGPGEAAVRRDGIAVVRTRDLALELHAGRREDDESALGRDALATLLGGSGAVA